MFLIRYISNVTYFLANMPFLTAEHAYQEDEEAIEVVHLKHIHLDGKPLMSVTKLDAEAPMFKLKLTNPLIAISHYKDRTHVDWNA